MLLALAQRLDILLVVRLDSVEEPKQDLNSPAMVEGRHDAKQSPVGSLQDLHTFGPLDQLEHALDHDEGRLLQLVEGLAEHQAALGDGLALLEAAGHQLVVVPGLGVENLGLLLGRGLPEQLVEVVGQVDDQPGLVYLGEAQERWLVFQKYASYFGQQIPSLVGFCAQDRQNCEAGFQAGLYLISSDNLLRLIYFAAFKD